MKSWFDTITGSMASLPSWFWLWLVATTTAASNNTTAIAWSSLSSPSHRHMIAFRSPSRNTYGFVDADLPQLEFRSLLTTVQQKATHNNAWKLVPAEEEDNDESTNLLFWVEKQQRRENNNNNNKESETTEEEIARATSRSILAHASYRITAGAASLDDLGKSLFSQEKNNVPPRVLFLDVVDMQNPNLSRSERLSLLSEFCRSIPNEFRSVVLRAKQQQQATTPPPHDSKNNPVFVLVRGQSGASCYFGICVARGPAASAGGGAPGTSPRRNYKGILGTLALKDRAHNTHSNTAMEPELAILMANLARIRSGDRILDPCCGSASLLLGAAAIVDYSKNTTSSTGVIHCVGIDRNATVLTGIHDEFRRHHLPIPVILEQGDVLQPEHHHEAFFSSPPSSLYDAILTDPPYNIGAPVLIEGQDQRKHKKDRGKRNNSRDTTTRTKQKEKQQQQDVITPAVFRIARQTLIAGGRLVFFLPVFGRDEASLSLSELLSKRRLQADDMDLVFGRLQPFTPTFSRWLVCMEKKKNRSSS